MTASEFACVRIRFRYEHFSHVVLNGVHHSRQGRHSQDTKRTGETKIHKLDILPFT